MTVPESSLQILIGKLNQHNIGYMLCGSYSSSLHGRPRATNDADIIIMPSEEQLTSFVKSLCNDYYVNVEAALDALKNRAMFNVIDIQNSFKVDFIIRKDRPFSREEFQRRQKTNLMGMEVWVVSPEDVILSKLEWAKESESSQQFQDALGVAVVQYDRLEMDYLYKWAREMKVENTLEQLLKQAKEQSNSG